MQIKNEWIIEKQQIHVTFSLEVRFGKSSVRQKVDARTEYLFGV